MSKRLVRTMWHDPRFRALPRTAKTLLIYLTTFVHVCGISRIRRSDIVNHLGITDPSVGRLARVLEKAGMVRFDWLNEIVWIRYSFLYWDTDDKPLGFPAYHLRSLQPSPLVAEFLAANPAGFQGVQP